MGLDEFIDVDGNSTDEDADSNTEATSTSSSANSLLQKDYWVRDDKGQLKQLGPYGYESYDDYEETIVGELETHGDMFKYYLPIFPHIEPNPAYERGKRYKSQHDQNIVACVVSQAIELRKINRELIILDTGRSDKPDCIEVLEQRFGSDVSPDDCVYLHFFCKTRHVSKMGLSDEYTEDLGVEEQDRILKAVHRESWTQMFREDDTSDEDLKGVQSIREW